MSSPNSISFDFASQLRAIPIRNESVERLESASDYLVLGIKLKYEGLMLPVSKILSMRSMKKYRLDGLGLSIYRELDGKHDVESLIDLMMERHKLSFFEARALISQYLDMLMRRGIVAVAVKESPGDAV